MPGGNNLHRVVIFRDGADRVSRVLPMSQFDSTDPEELWKYLMVYEEKTGGRALGIPHNGNLSNGLMFAVETRKGQRFDRAYAERRNRFEPLVEVTQPKGDGETHPLLTPTDEFAAFERWDQGNVGGTAVKEPGMHQYEYARSALKLGLRLEQQLGVNPFKFGMIGSTDTHTALSTTEEENYFGKIASVEPNAHRFEHPAIRYPQNPKNTILAWQLQAAGLAAVWARENTRESIWDALERKEVYGTTGSRPTVRFFGGWSFEPQDAKVRRPATVGYRKGVPMGGDLPVPQGELAGRSPTFLVAAAKDPYNGNLDRIQIIKGWLDGKGELQEKVYDVAWSGERKPDPKTGKLPPVGNTVDVANATWTNTIGSPELIAVWKDPAFDSGQRAFYYARVIEIPTPRWTAYDAKHFGIKMPPEVTMITQERAYTSPIWYTPGQSSAGKQESK